MFPGHLPGGTVRERDTTDVFGRGLTCRWCHVHGVQHRHTRPAITRESAPTPQFDSRLTAGPPKPYYAGSAYMLLGDAGSAQNNALLAIEMYETGPVEQRSYGDEALARVDITTVRLTLGDLDARGSGRGPRGTATGAGARTGTPYRTACGRPGPGAFRPGHTALRPGPARPGNHPRGKSVPGGISRALTTADTMTTTNPAPSKGVIPIASGVAGSDSLVEPLSDLLLMDPGEQSSAFHVLIRDQDAMPLS